MLIGKVTHEDSLPISLVTQFLSDVLFTTILKTDAKKVRQRFIYYVVKWQQSANCLETPLAPIGVSNWDIQALNPPLAIELYK